MKFNLIKYDIVDDLAKYYGETDTVIGICMHVDVLTRTCYFRLAPQIPGFILNCGVITIGKVKHPKYLNPLAVLGSIVADRIIPIDDTTAQFIDETGVLTCKLIVLDSGKDSYQFTVTHADFVHNFRIDIEDSKECATVHVLSSVSEDFSYPLTKRSTKYEYEGGHIK